MKQIIASALVIILILSSCETFRADQLLSKDRMRQEFTNDNVESFNHDDASTPFSITTKDNVVLDFKENSFVKNSTVFTGAIRIEFLFIHNQVDMILSGVPTVFRSKDDDFRLLRTGGEYFISAVDSTTGEQLDLNKNYGIQIPKSLTEAGDFKMAVFTAVESSDMFWTWPEPFGDGPLYVNETDLYYEWTFDSFGWINCDDFIEFGLDRHRIDFVHPAEFSETNSFVFLALDNYPSSLASLSIEIPENETGKLIFLARTNTSYHIAFEKFTAQSNSKIDFSDIELEIVNTADINTVLEEIINN